MQKKSYGSFSDGRILVFSSSSSMLLLQWVHSSRKTATLPWSRRAVRRLLSWKPAGGSQTSRLTPAVRRLLSWNCTIDSPYP